MKEWWEIPNQSDFWQKDTDYVMFIDENNSVSAIDIVFKKLVENKEISPNENVFTVTGCIFSKANYQNAKNRFDELRLKYWKNGQYYDVKSQNKKTVCFHSEDIRGRKKAFHTDEISEEHFKLFIKDLDTVLKEINFKIISINIFLSDYITISKYSD